MGVYITITYELAVIMYPQLTDKERRRPSHLPEE